ncbi:hypothetical protein [Smaragdicoccus niigatensis]|uniref:hypothetical protein n=1 Tax=Smaragdicoccus niigatensis TaxID=359359 RepID=UPI00036EF54F|nr:hypothetical protein [Smaragdicoccus niigatensis]
MTDQKPEVRRVARRLGVAPERIAYLEAVSDADLRALAQAVDNCVVELARQGSVGVGRLAKAIPVSAAAKVAERVGSPLMVARLAYFNDAQWATKMADKLSPELIAGAVAELDAATTVNLVAGMSEKLQFTVLELLVEQQEWVALGDLFGALPIDRVQAWAKQVSADQLTEIRVMVPDERRADVEKALG